MVIIEYLLDCKTVHCKSSEIDNYVSSGRIEYRNVGARMVQTIKLVQLESLVYSMIADLHKDKTLNVREKLRVIDKLKQIYYSWCFQLRIQYRHDQLPKMREKLLPYRSEMDSAHCVAMRY